MWARGKRLFLLVEASDLLMRIAIEDVLAVELSSIHPALPSLLLWHAARFDCLRSPHDREHGPNIGFLTPVKAAPASSPLPLPSNGVNRL